jgi:hypothetical protein
MERNTQAIYFLQKTPEFPDDVLHLNGRDIPFVIDLMYLGITFDRRMIWRYHIERTVAKAYSIFTYDILTKILLEDKIVISCKKCCI